MKLKLDEIELGKNWSRCTGVGDLSELVNSLRENGQITPVIVTPDRELVAGYRRVAAARELGWETVDAVETLSQRPGVINLVENMNREGLSLWEEIQAIRDVFGSDATQAEIGRSLGKTKTWVKPRVDVWTLSEAMIDKVRLGQSGVKEIKAALSERRGPSTTSRNFGYPSQPEIKQAITHLMGEGREAEARALSYAVGGITQEELLGISE